MPKNSKTELTQNERVLAVLNAHFGQWVNGRYFNDTLRISQYHARVHELQKQGYYIEASTFKDEYGFKSYRLLGKVSEQPQDVNNVCCYSFGKFGTHTPECLQRMQKPEQEIKQQMLL